MGSVGQETFFSKREEGGGGLGFLFLYICKTGRE